MATSSRGGYPGREGWYHNVKADPNVKINVGPQRFGITAKPVLRDDPDYPRLWQIVNKNGANPYATHQSRTSRPIPVVVLTAGWQRTAYNGTSNCVRNVRYWQDATDAAASGDTAGSTMLLGTIPLKTLTYENYGNSIICMLRWPRRQAGDAPPPRAIRKSHNTLEDLQMNDLPGYWALPAGVGEAAVSSDWETTLMLGDSE